MDQHFVGLVEEGDEFQLRLGEKTVAFEVIEVSDGECKISIDAPEDVTVILPTRSK